MSLFKNDEYPLTEMVDINEFFEFAELGDTFGVRENSDAIYKILKEKEEINSSKFTHKVFVKNVKSNIKLYCLFNTENYRYPRIRFNEKSKSNYRITFLTPNPIQTIREDF